MKGAILILVVMLVFSLAFSQQEEGAGEADSTKADTSEVDTVEVDSLEADTLEIDTLQTDTLKTETPGADTVQVDTSKVETPEVDTLKAESPEPDTLKADSLEVDTLETETPQPDTLKADSLEVDTLKVEIPGADTLRADSLEVDTLMADTLQADTTVEETPKVVVHKYIGTNTCMLCHNSNLKGRIYDAWDTTKHATAYVTLANEQSKAIAEEMGIEDAQQDSTCLKCHVTGFGLPATDKYSMGEGVTCEACHGPGEHYDDIRVMTKPELYEQKGMIVPDEELCVTCHNQESPTYKEFKYKDAFKLIEHRKPEKEIKDVFDLD
ncbi:MAG: multiheme c-type cytochrome [Candidatus Zixiibacteriota bacterium]